MRTPHQPGPLLTGKVALVTGGGGGIGRGISLAFAAHGATVIVAEIDEQRAQETVADIEAAGGRALAQVVDVTDPAGVERLAVDAGPVDVLVNNVGHYLFPAADFVESGPEEWEALYRINLGHVLLVTRAVLPGMIERGGAAASSTSRRSRPSGPSRSRPSTPRTRERSPNSPRAWPWRSASTTSGSTPSPRT
jgi:2-hydroxycyclohexanecarboxyl-CoA dehydrogenase